MPSLGWGTACMRRFWATLLFFVYYEVQCLLLQIWFISFYFAFVFYLIVEGLILCKSSQNLIFSKIIEKNGFMGHLKIRKAQFSPNWKVADNIC